jgi:hypothetical protein
MSNPMMRIHNMETNEVVDREMTDAEYADHQAAFLPEPLTAEEEAIEVAKAAAKVAVLERLGITAEEAALLLQ